MTLDDACVEHGPCDATGITATARLLELGVDLDILAAVHARAEMGEKKYGTVLRVGWAHGRLAAIEELLDAAAYLATSGDDDLVRELLGEDGILRRLLARCR